MSGVRSQSLRGALTRRVIVLVVGALVGVGYVGSEWLRSERRVIGRRIIVIPELSNTGFAGAWSFGVHCARCHGLDAGGTEIGPTLLDPIYRAAHHTDESLARAVRHGVVAHHWRFGNMSPVPELNAEKVTSVIVYIREVQAANGVK